MNWLKKIVTGPQRLFYDYGSRTAIFLIRRRVRRRPGDMGAWLLLARLHEVRSDIPQAIRVLEQALQWSPRNHALEIHLQRLSRLQNLADS